MSKYATPKELFTAICDAIRKKTGKTDMIAHEDIPDEIETIASQPYIRIDRIGEIYGYKGPTKVTLVNYDGVPDGNFCTGMFVVQNNKSYYYTLQVVDVSQAGGFSRVPDYMFYGCTHLSTIVNNQDITDIGAYSFYKCENIDIDFSKIKSIDNYGLKETKAIKDGIVLPECETIGNEALPATTSLTAPKLKTLGDKVFYQSTSITTIDLPVVESIGMNAFYSASYLAGDISLPELIEIKQGAFRSCTKITSFSAPKLTTGGNYGLSGCTKLKTINLSSLTSAPSCMFSQCNAMTTIRLPSCTSVVGTSTSNGAFYNSQYLTNATIGSVGHAVTSMGQYAFKGCTRLNTINIYIADGTTSLANAPFGCTNTSLKINYYSATTGELISTVTPNA